MKILITSDNHLGYKETDTIRKNDSFITFDEVLQIGVSNNVDLILQVGDLFHDNRPSRYCINRTINIIRKNIVDECIENENIPSLATYKLKIPFLCIHGNHDDPSGLNKISTLDILHSAGLVNYIGKDSILCDYVQYNNIRIYGVGYVKGKNVTDIFKKIEYKDLTTDFFNILLVHQNRVPRNKDYLCPTSVPDSFNMLIYGHEHDPVIIRNKTFLLQCGSTIRTSLCEAECNQKFCYIFETGINVLNKIKLNSIRPFIMEDTNLYEEKELINYINLLLNNENSLLSNENLEEEPKKQKISNEDFNDGFSHHKPITVVNLENNLKYPTLLPLVRLRILTTNVLNVNKSRLSHLFKDKISNPSEIIKLIPHKKIKDKPSTIVYQSQNITEIIANHLKCTPLECIPEYKFIEHFNKDSSFIDMVTENTDNLTQNIQYDNCLIADLESEIRKIKNELCKLHMVEKKANNNLENTNNSPHVDHFTDNNVNKVITAKDSKTLRKSINNNIVINNILKNEDIVDDFIKIGSPAFTSEISGMFDNESFTSKEREIDPSKVNNLDKEVLNNTNTVNKDVDDTSSNFIRLQDVSNNTRKIYEDESDSTDLFIDF